MSLLSLKNIELHLLMIALCMLSSCTKESPYDKRERPEIRINIAEPRFSLPEVNFSADTVYVMSSDITMRAGQTLRIQAGTLIKVADKFALTIEAGAVFEAIGTSTSPIVFTSSAYQGGAGVGGNSHYWYGIRIMGNSTGPQPELSSGSLKFVRLEFAGGDNASGLPALLLKDVANGTSIENIQVSYSHSNPSFEFSGGTVNARNLISFAGASTDFYFHDGHKGKMQTLIAYRHPFFPVFQTPDFAGVMILGSQTEPIISNLTVLGPGSQPGTSNFYSSSERRAGLITGGDARFQIRNSVFAGFPRAAWYMDDKQTALSITGGQSTVTHSIFQCNDTNRTFFLPPGVYPPYQAKDFKEYMLRPEFSNQEFEKISMLDLRDPFDFDNSVDPFPNTSSPILQGSDFSGVFSDPFFENVSFRGAFGTIDWLKGWTNFKPLQTNYNF